MYPQVYIQIERLPFCNLHISILVSRDSPGRSCDRQLLYITLVVFTPHVPLKSVFCSTSCSVLFFFFSSIHLSFASRKLIPLRMFYYFSLLEWGRCYPGELYLLLSLLSISMESGICPSILSFFRALLLQTIAYLFVIYIPSNLWVNYYSLVH